MLSLVEVLVLIWIFVSNRRLARRLERCEKKLETIESLKMPAESQVVVQPPPLPASVSTAHEVHETEPQFERGISQNLIQKGMPQLKKLIQIPTFIKENWLGVVGSMACVIGAVFFGITSGLFQHPEVRIAALLALSFLFAAGSIKLKEPWYIVRNLFRSTAGAIILFTALGAGGIEGLKCIHSETIACICLCAGIAVNIYLSNASPFQTVASLHVILSLLAFCIAPQELLFMPLGSVVAIVGLANAYRSKWDLHMILILFAFSILNVVWTWRMDLEIWMHYLAIACALVVSIVAAVIHYSKRYKTTRLEALPLIAHISNWILLAWNLYIHAQFSRWAALVLGIAAIAGFFLAKVAKKKGIMWLYRCDTIFAQVLALTAISSLRLFSVRLLDICTIALLEIVVFNFINNLLKERILIRIGYFIQALFSVLFLVLLFSQFTDELSSDHPLSIYCRIGAVVAISWGFYICIEMKKFVRDTVFYLVFGREGGRAPFSLMVIFGTICSLTAYAIGSKAASIQCVTCIVLLGLGLWRSRKEDLSWNLAFLSALSFIHLFSWYSLFFHKGLDVRIDFLALIIVDAILIFGNMLKLKVWKANIHNLVVYALAIQIGLVTYFYSEPVSLFIPAIAFLGYALIALEAARYIALKPKLQESLLHVGIGFMYCFIASFVTIYLQLEEAWNGISLRIIAEILGMSTLSYWIAYAPKNLKISKFSAILSAGCIELLLGFTSLVVFTEVSEFFRPMLWAVMALGLLVGTKYLFWPSRLYTYSWMYLIASAFHTAFATSNLVLPGQSVAEANHLHAFGAIFLQLVYAFIAHKKAFRNREENDSQIPVALRGLYRFLYRQPCITVLLPIFIGAALLFAFNYEKTLLTLFWVGLSSLYLALSLLVKSKLGIQIAMATLLICSIRLLVFDLVQSDISIRAIVFLGVGILMMLISIMYKKYKHRLEAV